MIFIAENKPGIIFRDLVQQFSPETKVIVKEEPEAGEDYIYYTKDERGVTVSTSDGFSVTTPIPERERVITLEDERIAFFRFLEKYYDKNLSWGMLTGVKPVKFYNRIERKGFNPREILTDRYGVSSEKVDLLTRIESLQRPVLDRHQNPGHVSLYLGIPICPQRCLYCSFVSTVLDRKRELLTDYLKALRLEILRTGEILNDHGIIVDAFYIGGGTPSVLRADEADALITDVFGNFNMSALEEFTFEAGRPETSSDELLTLLKRRGVSRICLNPQSFNDGTLRRINRSHTAEDIVERYYKMRELGYDSINMDLIAGLDGEDERDFDRSLKKAIELRPENITVHDLSIKHGSALNERDGKRPREAFRSDFHNRIDGELAGYGYNPYYMYRQKYTVGNGENVGYSLSGEEGIYNILMMAEEQTIIGLGAGSTGKLYEADKDLFKPVFTVKDIRTYNKRYEEIIDKKLNAYNDFFNRLRRVD